MISIIIPAHNEEKRINKTLEEYGKFFSNLKKRKEIKDYEIVVVLNGCKDRTIDVVREAAKKIKEIRHIELERPGKGLAIIEGFKDALKGKAEIIGFVDADLATTPESYYDLIRNIKNYDGIIASRYVKGAVVNPKQTATRIIVSRIFNFLVRNLFFLQYKDTQCGAKVFKRKALEKIVPRLGMTQWAFDIDLLYNAKKENFKIKEHPTFWQNKDNSKLNLRRASLQMFFAIVQLRILNSPFKRIWWFFKPIAGFWWGIVK